MYFCDYLIEHCLMMDVLRLRQHSYTMTHNDIQIESQQRGQVLKESPPPLTAAHHHEGTLSFLISF